MKVNKYIDNIKPEGYPIIRCPSIDIGSGNSIEIEIGDFIVNRDGHLMQATTSNKKYFEGNTFVDKLNREYFRAKYVGNMDDSLQYAKQCQLATQQEIDMFLKAVKETTIYKTHNNQLTFL